MKNKKIVSYTPRNNGCFWYREKIAFDALKRKEYNVSHADAGDQVMPDMEVVKFSRGYNPGFEEFMFMVKDKGIKIWYDVDDAMDLVKLTNPFSIPTRTYLGTYYLLLNEADFVTTSSENLAKHLRTKTSKPVHVFPNYINPTEWKMKRPQNKESGFRIGFAGSASHLKDLNIILPVIEELQKKYDFTFVLYGLDVGVGDIEGWYARAKENYKELFDRFPYTIELEKVYNILKNIKHEWNDGVRWELHPRTLAKLDLDIGLCPLLDDDFNDKKTPIKFYEYAMVDTPAIASRVTPFQEEALALADNEFASWYETIEAMIIYDDLRMSTLRAQQEYVKNNRLVDDHISELEKILELELSDEKKN